MREIAPAARGILTLVCSQTGGEMSSGVVYTRADLERAKPAQMFLHCPHCGELHLFMFADAVLKPVPYSGNGIQETPTGEGRV